MPRGQMGDINMANIQVMKLIALFSVLPFTPHCFSLSLCRYNSSLTPFRPFIQLLNLPPLKVYL